MREMPADQTRVKKLIADTIILLCQQGLSYSVELKIQGVVAVTVDRCDTFVVQLDVTTTQNRNSTKKNPDLHDDKKAYVDNDDVIEVLPVVDLTRQEDQPPKPSTPRTPAMPRTPATPRGLMNPGRRGGVSSRNLFAQPVSPQVGASPQRSRPQLTSSRCISVGVGSPVNSSPSRFSGPVHLAPSAASACRPHKPASDAVMVIEDDRDDVVIVASNSGATTVRGGTLDKRVQQSTSGTSNSNPPSPAVTGKVPSRVSASSDWCNLSVAETHVSLANHDYDMGQQVSQKSKSDALSVSSFSTDTSFPPSSVQLSGAYVPKTPDCPSTFTEFMINSSSVSQSSIVSSEASSRPFVIASSTNSQFIPPPVSDSSTQFVASTNSSSNGTDSQVFRAVNGVSGRSSAGLGRGSCEEVPNYKSEVPVPFDTVVLNQRPTYHVRDPESGLELNVNMSAVDRASSQVNTSCVESASVVGACRGTVVGHLTLDPPATSQSKAVAVTSVGSNCSSPSLFIQLSTQHEQTEDNKKQVALVLKPRSIVDASVRKEELHHLWVTKTESIQNSDDAGDWSLLSEVVSLPNDPTLPEVYTDIADDGSGDDRQNLVMDERDEMQESGRFFTPFQCKFPGCVGSYVDGAQLANHYSIHHTESMDLVMQQQQPTPENTESPEADKSTTSDAPTTKSAFPCPSKGCQFVAELFCEVSAHHRQVHSRSISPRVRQQMIWRNRDRACRSSKDASSERLKAQADVVEDLLNLLPDVSTAPGDQCAPPSKKPLYGCLCIDGSCRWTTSSWDELLSHMHVIHNFIIDSKSTESSIKAEPFAG